MAIDSAPFEFFADLLRRRAATQGDQVAFTFLDHQGEKAETLTYAQLLQSAQQTASSLADCVGKTVLLLYPPGPELVQALFACLFHGVVAVPARPPHPNRLFRADPRLAAIIQDARATLILTTRQIAAAEAGLQCPEQPLFGLPKRVIRLDRIQPGQRERLLQPEAAALVQYTSGSTATPRGVVISHRSLMDNQAQMVQWLQTNKSDRLLSWLPPYHDMGLMGVILHTVYSGARCWLMDPLDFARKPTLWLQAISRFHITLSGAPNFAYAEVVRRISSDDQKRLDLQRWRGAICGGEPIHAEVLDAFAEKFVAQGFVKKALTPCYGLAESTLFVTGAALDQEPRYLLLDRQKLAEGQVGPVEDQGPGSLWVSCGQAGSSVQVVDVPTGQVLGEGSIGEIWVATPGSANHYHHRKGLSEATFGLQLPGGSGPFLRTGDLGFLKQGHLFICGRLKELIIVRGRNHYPQDLEWTVSMALAHLGLGQGAAFGLTIEGEERLALVWEVRETEPDGSKVADLIRCALQAEHGVQPEEIVLVAAGSLPRTTSGKKKRLACRELYMTDQLEVLYRNRKPAPFAVKPLQNDMARTLALIPTDVHRHHLITDYLSQTLGRILGLDPEVLGGEWVIAQLGLDSMSALELSYQLEVDLGCRLALDEVFSTLTLQQLALRVLALWHQEERPEDPTPGDAPQGRHPLSYQQREIWWCSSKRGLHNHAYAAILPEQVDLDRVKQALDLVLARHSSLRTTLGIYEGEPFQEVHPELVLDLEEIDGSEWCDPELREHLADASHFPLGEGPFWRVRLFHRRDLPPVILWVLDPIAVDLWSLALMAHEFCDIYVDLCAEKTPKLPELPLCFSDFVGWQERRLLGPEGDRLWRFWQRVLLPLPAPLHLPYDRAAQQLRLHRAAIHHFEIPTKLVWQLDSLGRERQTTLFAVLLSAWCFLLQRYSGQEEFLTGFLCSGRDRADLSGLVGPLENPLPIRVSAQGHLRFSELLDRLHKDVLAARKHALFPYALMKARVFSGESDLFSELFKTMFLFQSRPPLGDAGLTGFAIGGIESTLNHEGFELRSLGFEQPLSSHELMLTVAETRAGGDLWASLTYRSELFEASSIERMAQHLINLLEALTHDPELLCDEWHLLGKAERAHFLLDHPQRRVRRRRTTLHQLFQKQASLASETKWVTHLDRSWTYVQLNEHANRIAHLLISEGVGPEVPVGLCCERSLEMVAAVLGVLKAGGALVPIEPGSVIPGLEKMCQLVLCPDYLAHHFAGLTLKLLPVHGDHHLLANQSSQILEIQMEPTSLAYLRYQPSDGQGHWIQVSHANLVQLPSALAPYLEMSRPEVNRKPVWCAASFLNDVGGLAELLLPLAMGNKLVLGDPKPLGIDQQAPLLRFRQLPMSFSLVWESRSDVGHHGVARSLLASFCQFSEAHGYEGLWLMPEARDRPCGGSLVWGTLAAMETRDLALRYLGVSPDWSEDQLKDWRLVKALAGGRLSLGFRADNSDQGEQLQSAMKRVNSETGPVWIWVAPGQAAFEQAGRLGAMLVLRANGLILEGLAEWIQAYRQSRAQAGFEGPGLVTFMLPTWVSQNEGSLPDLIQPTYRRWLQAQGLEKSQAKNLAREVVRQPHPTQALFGSASTCALLVDQLKGFGVDQIACEVGFGLPAEMALAGLAQLDLVRRRVGPARTTVLDTHFLEYLQRHRVSHLHCNGLALNNWDNQLEDLPSTGIQHLLLSADYPVPELKLRLAGLRGLTVSLIQGQGETTSSALILQLGKMKRNGPKPLPATQAYVLRKELYPCELNERGELAIGGAGVSRGYGNNPRLTALRFVPDPFGDEVGGRLFLTGLIVKHRIDGGLVSLVGLVGQAKPPKTR